jgi:hypothetical protein
MAIPLIYSAQDFSDGVIDTMRALLVLSLPLNRNQLLEHVERDAMLITKRFEDGPRLLIRP